MPSVRVLDIADLELIRSIDRSERVDAEYAAVDGRLTRRPVSVRDIPGWDPGCVVADPVHPDLYALEPDDVHLVCDL